MPAKTDRNKAFAYDWAIIDAADKSHECRQLTQGQQMVLVALCEYLGWATRWTNPPDRDTLLAFRDQLIYDIITEVDCMNCEELTACLQPLFDMLQEQVDATNAIVEQIAEVGAQNAATAPEPISAVAADCYQWGAAYAVFDAMDTRIKQEYARAETTGVDDTLQWWQSLVLGIPLISELPYDEMLGMVNAFYENQVTDYETDVPLARDPAAGDLVCRVVTNGGQFTFEVWGAWLAGLTGVIDNHATQVLTRFAPASQTFLNQIAAFFNKNQSLQDWFTALYQAYFVGLATCADVPVGYSCTPMEPEIGIFSGSSCSAPAGGDDLAFDDLAGVWTASGTPTGTGAVRLSIRRLGGGLFKYNTFNSNVGIAGSAWTNVDDTCGLAIGGMPPENTFLKDLVWVIQDTGTPLDVSFNFYE